MAVAGLLTATAVQLLELLSDSEDEDEIETAVTAWTSILSPKMEFSIKTTWDGDAVDHEPVKLKLEGSSSGLTLTCNAPFFDDPKPPGGKPGQPFPNLWEYEVVEVFFLNDKNQYLEVEIAPHGEHLLLLLDGVRHPIRDKLPMEYHATIHDKKWKGTALIPLDYFPCHVTKINCYAIHGVGDKRYYEALYPTPKGRIEQPDFHGLEYFQNIDFASLVPQNTEHCSDLWKNKQGT